MYRPYGSCVFKYIWSYSWGFTVYGSPRIARSKIRCVLTQAIMFDLTRLGLQVQKLCSFVTRQWWSPEPAGVNKWQTPLVLLDAKRTWEMQGTVMNGKGIYVYISYTLPGRCVMGKSENETWGCLYLGFIPSFPAKHIYRYFKHALTLNIFLSKDEILPMVWRSKEIRTAIVWDSRNEKIHMLGMFGQTFVLQWKLPWVLTPKKAVKYLKRNIKSSLLGSSSNWSWIQQSGKYEDVDAGSCSAFGADPVFNGDVDPGRFQNLTDCRWKINSATSNDPWPQMIDPDYLKGRLESTVMKILKSNVGYN